MGTPFAIKCEILTELYSEYLENNVLSDFVEAYDLGIPMALLAVNGAAVPTEDGIEFVHEAWVEMCNRLELDPRGEYVSFHSMMDYSAAEEIYKLDD